jgi:IgGFc binding protein
VNGTAPSTEIWGDGNASNGCAPDVMSCTNSNDRLMAGDSIVIQNTIALPRVQQHIRYDGSDRIQASFPIAVTRGAYPVRPGSVMAGAVEVFDTAAWGNTFEAPVGADVGKTYQAFEISMFFIMAAEDRTKVTLANGYVISLNQGQGTAISVNIGEQIKSNKPIQVDLITGDRGSFYEMRVSYLSLVVTL